MKKITMIALAVISATLLFSSCKKEHTCNCDIKIKSVTVANMSDYEPLAGTINQDGTAEIELEESSNKAAKAACISSEQTEVEVYQDEVDFDFDGNTSENAYTVTTTTTEDCSLE